MPAETTPLTPKQLLERAAFDTFINRMGRADSWKEVENRPEPEPDLLCISSSGERVAFELVSLTDELIAKVMAAGSKARTEAFLTSDPSAKVVWNKLTRSYRTEANRIELLIYTDGRLVTPDDVILATIRPILDARDHPFSIVWFMGERETLKLWSNT